MEDNGAEARYKVEEKSTVEAALFAASEPLTAADIADRTGMDISVIRYALKDLRMEYEMRDSAIIISAIDGNYRMQLRAEYQKYSGVFAAPEFPTGVMRTLSTIAYNQPVLQSQIVKVRGPRGYADIATLVDAGYVHSKPKGQSYELTTTKKFSEDFGIGSTRPEDIKEWILRNSKGVVQRKAPQTEAEIPAEDSGDSETPPE